MQAGSAFATHVHELKSRNSSPEQSGTHDVPHCTVPAGQPQTPLDASRHAEPAGQQFCPQGTVLDRQTHWHDC
jgi:hypothetical protein